MVTVDRSAGSKPILTPLDEETRRAALERAKQLDVSFLEFTRAYNDNYAEVIALKVSKVWLSERQWKLWMESQSIVGQARIARSYSIHSRRIEALEHLTKHLQTKRVA
jgi:hypothetical protein